MSRMFMVLGVMMMALTAHIASAQQREYPPFERVSEGLQQVVSTADGARSLYTLYVNRETGRILAELPPNFANQRIFIATSIAGGSRQTGWQWNDLYAYWERFDNQLALMMPNLQYQARGGQQDAELRASVERTFSDRVLTSVPILTFGPNRGPVIDLGALLVGNSQLFTGMRGNAALARLGNVKAFPGNLEIPITIPMAQGELTTLHYSISLLPRTDYRPREADERIGYFMTVFKDFTKNDPADAQFTRLIHRWHVQKRDPNLAMSPPREPIVFYIEHTVPVRYRRYVREGILEWNKAFERIGIIDAIEVRQQDAQTGAFMDLDPEDVRYNFFRWITSEQAFAMGPSRVHPETGQILDADIIFDDSMLKYYVLQYEQMIETFGMDGVDPQTARWLDENPRWNPLERFSRPNPLKERVLNNPDLTDEEKAELLGIPRQAPRDGIYSRVVQQNLSCDYAMGKAMQMRTAHIALQMMQRTQDNGDQPMIDGAPEQFVGDVIREIVMHEVGHTLGLRHNFKAAAWKSLDEYRAIRGEANVGSVMDYNPIDIVVDPESPRGDWVPTTLGPYDYWAIEFGYALEQKQADELLKKVADASLQFATDEDASGPDPLVNRFVLGDPLEWANARIELVHTMREKLLEKSLDDGQSWHLLRQAYLQMLGEQVGALRTASRYLGGTYIHRDRKGDPDGRDPIVPVEAAKQRQAIEFLIAHGLRDDAFDVRPEILRKLASDKNRHWGNFSDSDESFSIHDRVSQVQSFALMYLMNPATLVRIHDNELRKNTEEDALTLPELMSEIMTEIYRELRQPDAGQRFTNRQPMISSLRRNLQSEMTVRLIDLSSDRFMPRPVQTLANMHMRELHATLESLLTEENRPRLDDYTRAHLMDLETRVRQAIEAIRITGNTGMGGLGGILRF